MALTDAECRTATPGPKLEKISDGGGLQIWLQPTGVRLWRLAYRFRGKQKLLALGVYPTVLLARARQARDDAKRLSANGIDPGAERKRLTQEHAAAVTFQAIADEYLSKLKREKRAEATLAKTMWLMTFATAEFGKTPIKDIDAPSILKVLQAVQRRGRYESARRAATTVSKPPVASNAPVDHRQCVQIGDRHRPGKHRPNIRPTGGPDPDPGCHQEEGFQYGIVLAAKVPEDI